MKQLSARSVRRKGLLAVLVAILCAVSGAKAAGAASVAPAVESEPTPAEVAVTYAVASIDASGFQSPNSPQNAIDGNPADDSRWSAKGREDVWLQLDLGVSHPVNALDITFLNADRRDACFTIETSMNGSTWTTQRSNIASNGKTTFSIPETTARYVRYQGLGNSASAWNSIIEIDVRRLPPTGNENTANGDGSECEPPGPDNDLPLGNTFYGQYQAGWHTGNAAIAAVSSRRFRAVRSGLVDTVSYNNRVLADDEVSRRCSSAAPLSAWCRCVSANLDGSACGYTLGNSYSVGNGGSITIEIREDDGSAEGLPKEAAIGRTATPFVPAENAANQNPRLELAEPVQLMAGRIYHLVYVNENLPTSCALSSVPISSASSCPRDQGAIGLNGVELPRTLGLDGGHDPFRGTSAANFTKRTEDSSWVKDLNTLSWFGLRYTDGVWTGDLYAAYRGYSTGQNPIGGDNVARQIFTVQDATRTVDGLWLNFGHDHQASSDGSPLAAKLRDENGNQLATGTIAASTDCMEIAEGASSIYDQQCREWGYTNLSSAVSLVEGATYSVEFSASADSGFVISTAFELDYGQFRFESRNFWYDSKAEISSDGGQTFGQWDTSSTRSRDMGLLFTIEGKPKRLR